MTEEKIQCPFCGNMIDKNVEECPYCNELFVEPNLPDIKFKEFRIFFALNVVTFGFFSYIWCFLNAKAINRLVIKPKDTIKFNWLIGFMVINLMTYLFYLDNHLSFAIPLLIIQYFIYILITYRVLRIVDKYTTDKYGVNLEFNPYYIFFFNILYLVHVIDTYSNRVQHTHEYFDLKTPQGVALVILLIILAIIVRSFQDVYLAYMYFLHF